MIHILSSVVTVVGSVALGRWLRRRTNWGRSLWLLAPWLSAMCGFGVVGCSLGGLAGGRYLALYTLFVAFALTPAFTAIFGHDKQEHTAINVLVVVLGLFWAVMASLVHRSTDAAALAAWALGTPALNNYLSRNNRLTRWLEARPGEFCVAVATGWVLPAMMTKVCVVDMPGPHPSPGSALALALPPFVVAVGLGMPGVARQLVRARLVESPAGIAAASSLLPLIVAGACLMLAPGWLTLVATLASFGTVLLAWTSLIGRTMLAELG